MEINFKIIQWLKGDYHLDVDGQLHFKAQKGELRKIFYEMEKIARLRFKGELKHE